MRTKRLTAILASVSTLTLSSCGISAHVLTNSTINGPSYYKTIKYRTTDTSVHFNGQTEVTIKPNRPFYTVSRPEAIKDGFVLSCWTTKEHDLSTKIKSTQNIDSDLVLYPYFIEATVLKDVIYSVVQEDSKTVLYLWNKDPTSPDSICPADTTNMGQNITGTKVTSTGRTSVTIVRNNFNYPVSFGTEIHEIPNNFLYGAIGFDSEVSIPEWINKIGNNFLYGCTNYDKHLVVPTSIKTIGTNFLYNCQKFNKDLILNSTLEAIGTGFMVENKAFTSKLTIDCPVSAFTGNINNSLYASKAEDNLFKVGYEIDGTNAIDWWSHHYVDINDTTNNKYRRRKATRFTTTSVTTNTKTEYVKDDYTFTVYYDDFTSWDSTFKVILLVSRQTALQTSGTILMNTFSIVDESGQEFNATQAGRIGSFDYDAEYVVLDINLKDANGNPLYPRGNLTIKVNLDFIEGDHKITGQHNLDNTEGSYKYKIGSQTNENVSWSVIPASAGSITDNGMFTPSESFKSTGGSATIMAKKAGAVPTEQGYWEDSFEIEMSTLNKLTITKIDDSTSSVKMLNNTITGDVIIPSRYWHDGSSSWSSVVSIGDNDFNGCSGITYVKIPNTITSVGNNAFSNCSNLSTIDFSTWTNPPQWTGQNIFSGLPTVGTIKNNTFDTSYNEIDKWRINNSFKDFLDSKGISQWSASNWKFEHNDDAKLVQVDNANVVVGWSKALRTTPEELSDAEKYNLAMEKYGKATIQIPKEAVSIKEGCFINDSKQSTIPATLPELSFESGSAIQSIGSKAFYNSTNLKSINWANVSGLTTIGEFAFVGSGLTTMTTGTAYTPSLPASLTSIGSGAFYETKLTTLIFPMFTSNVTMGEGAFAGNYELIYIDVSAYDTKDQWAGKVSAHTSAFDNCSQTGQLKGKTLQVAKDMIEWFIQHSNVFILEGWTPIA